MMQDGAVESDCDRWRNHLMFDIIEVPLSCVGGSEMAGEGDGDRELVLPPGFRFHPTDEELITHYLRPKTVDSKFSSRVIGDVDLNRVEPWDLPWKAKMGEKEWYFFCIKDRKYPTGSRTNRATQAGYWKATGKDKEIFRGKALVGMKKTLVFYKGRAPRGEKTNWVMHEYRLESKDSLHTLSANKGEWVINRVFKKSSNGKKVHISGLYESPSSCSSAQPPLTELPSGSAAAVAEVTSGTSNSQEERETTGELSPFEGNSSYRDSVFPRDQSFLNLLVENYGAYARQHGGGYEFFPESDLSATFAYAFLPQEHPYDHPLYY